GLRPKDITITLYCLYGCIVTWSKSICSYFLYVSYLVSLRHKIGYYGLKSNINKRGCHKQCVTEVVIHSICDRRMLYNQYSKYTINILYWLYFLYNLYT